MNNKPQTDIGVILTIGLFICFVGAFGLGNYLSGHPNRVQFHYMAITAYVLMPLSGVVGIVMTWYVYLRQRKAAGLAWALLPIPFAILFFAVFGQNVSA